MEIVNQNPESRTILIKRNGKEVEALVPKGRSKFKENDFLVHDDDPRLFAVYTEEEKRFQTRELPVENLVLSDPVSESEPKTEPQVSPKKKK